MANTFTDLVTDAYVAADKVSRELVGMIPAVGGAMNDQRVAIGQEIIIPITRTAESIDIVPSMNLVDPADQTTDNVKITVTKSKAVPFAVTGEEQLSLSRGPGYVSIQVKNIMQAMRTLTNEVEADLALEARLGASRTHGTSGTTPFSSNLGDMADTKKILKDNGAPLMDLQMVMDTTAGANLYKLTQLTNANEGGDGGEFLRQGMLGARPLNGFSLRESGNMSTSTAGTAAGATTDATGYAEGATTVTIAAAGAGTLVAGDSITVAGDTNQYVVAVGNGDVSAGGAVQIAKPGLRQAIPAAATAITVTASYVGNVAFDRDAIQLITRAPAIPDEGDVRIDSELITDPVSGLTFELSMWAGNRKVRYEIALAWGFKAIKPEHIVGLKG